MTERRGKCKNLKSVERIISYSAEEETLDIREICSLTEFEADIVEKIMSILVKMGLLKDHITPTNLGLFVIGQM